MPNLRVIYDNVADKATVAASSTAGGLVASNLLTDTKVAVHRSAGTSVTYTLTWSAAQQVGAVALPATNLSPTATARVRLFSDTAGTALLVDSAVRPACPADNLGLHGWSKVDANAFAHGGASKVAIWLEAQPADVRRCEITLSDPDNAAGYIDCSRIVAGPFWESPRNPDYGVRSGISDLTKTQRADSGDLIIQRGAQYETLSFSVKDLNEAARAELRKLLRSAGSHRLMFYSLLPDNESAAVEQDHMVYGRRSASPFTFDFFNSFSMEFEIEGW